MIRCMAAVTEIDYRNRALIAFTLLTGARVSAIASLRLKHIDLTEGRVIQDAREVRTKFSKTFITYFFPVGEDILAIFSEWVRHLRTDKLWGNDDALFPATRVALGHNRQFEVQGLERTGWDSAGPIRAIFQKAFCHAGLAYCHPHSFRRTLVQLGQKVCRTPEEFKSWSQNLGHDQVPDDLPQLRKGFGPPPGRDHPSPGTPSRPIGGDQLAKFIQQDATVTGMRHTMSDGSIVQVRFHPLADLFPPMRDKEFTALKIDIKTNGLRTPIVMMNDEVLDGRCRYRACKETGVEPRYEEYTGADPLAYVISANLQA